MIDLELPEVRNRVEATHINGTPEGYAMRILLFYRERCNEKWAIDGEGIDGLKALYGAMNDHQDMRAADLERAIAILSKEM